MPGITGIICKKPCEKNAEDLRLMINSMMHEPFYTSGTYINDQLGLYLGWVCHKDSFSDCMPVVNEINDLVLLFAGENFVDNDVTDELKRRGHEFDPSNASYLIHLCEENKKGFLGQLNGWFSGILVDLRNQEVILFNDRYGMSRIYYSEGEDEFLFSSEAKSLLKVRPELRKMDMRSLGEFFACDCTLENRSLFSGISVLPGGSSWTFHNSSQVKKDYYFKPDIWENQPILEKELFYNRLRETFLSILPRYFQAKQPIAISLTSGLDTRAIMSNLGKLSDGIPCYTFSGMKRDTYDAIIARRVADESNQTHQVMKLDVDFFSNFPINAEKTIYVTDGCHDVCGSHDVYFNILARGIAPIRMTGKFGSEIIGSHSMFKKEITLCEKLFQPDFEKHIDEAVRTFTEIKNGHRLSFAVFKEIPWHEYGRLVMEASKLTIRTPYMDNDLVKLMYQAPANSRASMEIRLRLIGDGNLALRKIMTDRGTAGESNYISSKLVQLYFYSLFKAEYIYLYQLPHWVEKVDSILALLHPERLILGRYQFVHYPRWFRNELSDYVRGLILDDRAVSRGYLNKKFLEEMVSSHIKGDRNYTNEINKIVTAELVQRLLVENI